MMANALSHMKTRAQISYNMSKVRGAGSVIEVALARAMRTAGIRYRKQYKALPGKPDFVIVSARVAVFCDSSFWHGRDWPDAARAFKSNRDFWINKIERNIARDKEVNSILERAGWMVVRFWDHEIKQDASLCASRMLVTIRHRTPAKAMVSN
jgi:DNA mismatch endonuclease Vsr